MIGGLMSILVAVLLEPDNTCRIDKLLLKYGFAHADSRFCQGMCFSEVMFMPVGLVSRKHHHIIVDT